MAPQSISSAAPFAVGIRGASGARSTPLIFPTRIWPPASTAPELPADTKASASPRFTSFKATTIEESFLLRIAATGGSAVSITSDAFTISICSLGYVYADNPCRRTSSRPVSRTLISFRFCTASTAPLIISPGALSPPMASRATLVISDISIPPCIAVIHSTKHPSKNQEEKWPLFHFDIARVRHTSAATNTNCIPSPWSTACFASPVTFPNSTM